MSRLGTNFKVCQTCRYWGGIRELNGFLKTAETQNGTKGKCNNTKGFYNQNMSNMATCKHYDPIF